MAKGKKSKGTTYVSKGIHCQRDRYGLRKQHLLECRGSLAEAINKHDAWRAFKNVVLTIENPNKNETAKRFIRVNAREVWGSPKR
jgi:hypothetical protein